MIVLPRGNKYELNFELRAINKSGTPAKIKVEFRCANKTMHSEILIQQDNNEMVNMYHKIPHETPQDTDCGVILKLIAPKNLSSVYGRITIQ
ncbi:MAG: hypothetical protein FWB80_04870 [Defluviitaleaceae bacterium]|nr:hypothetical protein [Defluviitaleaceae bacterium]